MYFNVVIIIYEMIQRMIWSFLMHYAFIIMLYEYIYNDIHSSENDIL